MAYHPPEATFALLRRVRQRAPADFISLNKVLPLAGNKNAKFEPSGINSGRGAELASEKENAGGVKRNNDFIYANEPLLSAVRTLMYGYVLVSRIDPERSVWCELGAATVRINAVEYFARLSAKFSHLHHLKITDAEASVRTEWTRVQQLEPGLSLTQIIDQVSKRYTN